MVFSFFLTTRHQGVLPFAFRHNVLPLSYFFFSDTDMKEERTPHKRTQKILTIEHTSIEINKKNESAQRKVNRLLKPAFACANTCERQVLKNVRTAVFLLDYSQND
ncbi:hypothetical protein, unlikely [Trypanosoma brucei gambiense DAL972]|uniref:Uncharacterized protein n=1 Tax=Trypanosoma brucei gambiense (strain MHOM/CI/86/DAL972) TaxID=679716 RepID=D0A739_TRYB9|nr:hypothetical protein, unlikely [Trypanosoma brucei gambiense DAL972]CBH17490.1 hypothetical protein, unlikely [Trypanosoma brucei gambiense DAL972]|eukprot:XP_011779754.1 hypothetical protein, unlikely [Trypanosoma brucei gambiense DAL972]